MMDNQPKNHTALIVVCITITSVLSGVAATFLLWKGFQSGELFVQVASNAVAGLLGFLGGKATMSVLPDKLKISNSPSEPVPVIEKPAENPTP